MARKSLGDRAAGAALMTGSLREALAQSSSDWIKQVGLELFTVRDAMQIIRPGDADAGSIAR